MSGGPDGKELSGSTDGAEACGVIDGTELSVGTDQGCSICSVTTS